MGIEAKKMAGPEGTPEGDDNIEGSQTAERPSIDKFYTERYDGRLNDGFSSPVLTYMEEKSLFWYQQQTDSGNSNRNSAALNQRTLLVPRPPALQAQGPPAAAGIGVPVRFPDFRPAVSDQSGSFPFADLQPTPSRKPSVRMHRHLVDQHMLGRPSVDDEHGAMRTAPVSLSADFYHPPIAAKRKSSLEKELVSVLSPTSASAGLTVPPIPTPPPSNETTPAATPRRGEIVNNGNNATDAAGSGAVDLSSNSQIFRTPTQLAQPPMLSPPQLHVHQNSPPGTPPRVDHPVLSNVDVELYSSASLPPPQTLLADEKNEDIRSHLRSRFAAYQRRLDLLLTDRNNEGFEEFILDFWDEFLPATANVHFYDRYTAVPRVSRLHDFLTKPCPKAIGVIQCEIERIKVTSKKKGVNMKGRLFPSYEYRLFIRDRRHYSGVDSANRNPAGEPRRDTVLMIARNRGKKHGDTGESSAPSSKKGVNNYYLCLPKQSDVDAHYNLVNEVAKSNDKRPNGASFRKTPVGSASQNGQLGRLQSNFIGTEFQIYSHEQQKQPARPIRSLSSIPYSDGENELDYDSGVSSDTMSTSSRSQRRRSSSSQRKSKKSLRRNSGQPQPIDEDFPTQAIPERRRSLRRAVSLPVYSRPSRTSRRAIAHSVEPVEPHQPIQFVTAEHEEGAITYTANLLGNRPRIMDVCIPKVSPEGVAGAEWKRYLDSVDDEEGGSSNRMLTCFKQFQARAENPVQGEQDEDNIVPADDDYVPPDDFGLLALQNRPPWWNLELGAFVLNFGGRVSVASVKNFQLCDKNDQEHIMLQFGRIQGRHSFTMDYQHPLTAVQAFAIAISSLQSKISFG
jgi:hypothetical protein